MKIQIILLNNIIHLIILNLIFILCLLIFKGEENRNAYGWSPYNEEIIQE